MAGSHQETSGWKKPCFTRPTSCHLFSRVSTPPSPRQTTLKRILQKRSLVGLLACWFVGFVVSWFGGLSLYWFGADLLAGRPQEANWKYYTISHVLYLFVFAQGKSNACPNEVRVGWSAAWGEAASLGPFNKTRAAQNEPPEPV